MSISFTKSGILNTVQDLGRYGHRREGINPGGAMDHESLRILNILLGNDENEAAIELHFPAGEIVFGSACMFALTGADFDPHLDGVAIATGKTHSAREGSVLNFRRRINGQRAYFGIGGGFDLPDWLGSKSTNLAVGVGGFCGRSIVAGDRLEFNDREQTGRQAGIAVGQSLIPHLCRPPVVRIVLSPEFNLLTPLSTDVLSSGQYGISNDSNRMGYRLEGESLYLMETVDIISTAVEFGTIQLLPNGQLVVLMADHQTTGGYPRVCQVVRSDLPLLGQLGAGDRLSFALISVAEAEALDMELERRLRFLKVGRRLKIGE
jgi:antagonist of KipI